MILTEYKKIHPTPKDHCSGNGKTLKHWKLAPKMNCGFSQEKKLTEDILFKEGVNWKAGNYGFGHIYRRNP